MKKLLVGILVLALSIFGAPAVHAVDTNNFTISSYTVDMALGRDSDKRSTLAVKETIVAEFPSYDQNHGLERVFVQEYDGHSLGLTVTSVTDESGTALEHSLQDGVMRIGSADTYVRGSKTYVIEYTMRDVTKYFSDTGLDEFYWDVIGVNWQVPITIAQVRLVLDTELQSARSGTQSCYRGVQDETAQCELLEIPDGYTAQAEGLLPGEAVTVAVGFAPGTFAAYQQSLIEKLVGLWMVAQMIAMPLGLVFVGWFFVRWNSRMNRKKEIGTIIPEYIPPSIASVTTAARVAGYATSVMAAQMLDFAVRHYIKIYEVKEKTIFSPAQYEIEIVKDITDLRQEEQELLKDTFGALPSVGSRMNLKELQNNPSYFERTLNNDADLEKLIQGEYGFREPDSGAKAWSRRVSGVALAVGVLLLSPFWFVAALIVFAMSFVPWRLTEAGLGLKRYLEGLKLYIGVAETDRINMLQSPDAAEKTGGGTDSAQLVKLYERVLPYAVLFGQEKQWNKQLGKYYETANTSPDWYAGRSTLFNAAVFSSAMSSFSQANNYTSSSSSSSGGSGGGGSAGGGGGGGGGGGW